MNFSLSLVQLRSSLYKCTRVQANAHRELVEQKLFRGKRYPILCDNWYFRLNFPSLLSNGTEGRGTIFFRNVDDDLREHAAARSVASSRFSRVKFTKRCFAIQWKGIQSVGRGWPRLLVSLGRPPCRTFQRRRRTDERTNSLTKRQTVHATSRRRERQRCGKFYRAKGALYRVIHVTCT